MWSPLEVDPSLLSTLSEPLLAEDERLHNDQHHLELYLRCMILQLVILEVIRRIWEVQLRNITVQLSWQFSPPSRAMVQPLSILEG